MVSFGSLSSLLKIESYCARGSPFWKSVRPVPRMSTSAQGGHHFNSDCLLYSGRSSRTRTCRKLEPTRRQHHWHHSTDVRSWKKMATALAGDGAVSDRIRRAYQPD